VKKFLVFILLALLIYFLFTLTRTQQVRPSKLGADKTDVFAIPLDTSPTEERQNKERLQKIQKELEEERAQEQKES